MYESVSFQERLSHPQIIKGFLYTVCGLFVFATILTGCPKPIAPEKMIPTQIGTEYLISNGPFYKSISVSNVGGGKETNPMMFSEIGNPELEEAIITSLRGYNYHALSTEDAKYKLNVFLVEVDRPKSGFTTTITAFVRYKLSEIENNRTVIDELVKTTDTKTGEEVFVGITRMRIAQEEAIKKNIIEFIKILFAFNKAIPTRD